MAVSIGPSWKIDDDMVGLFLGESEEEEGKKKREMVMMEEGNFFQKAGGGCLDINATSQRHTNSVIGSLRLILA